MVPRPKRSRYFPTFGSAPEHIEYKHNTNRKAPKLPDKWPQTRDDINSWHSLMVLGVQRSNHNQNKAREAAFLNKALTLEKNSDRLFYVPGDMQQLDALLAEALETYCQSHTTVYDKIQTISVLRRRVIGSTMMTARKILSIIYNSLAVDDTIYTVGLQQRFYAMKFAHYGDQNLRVYYEHWLAMETAVGDLI